MFFARTCIALASVLTLSAPAAAVINFDDLPGSTIPVPAGYAGLNWDNFWHTNPAVTAPVSGYANGTISAPNVAFNAFGDPAAISAAAPFQLTNGWFTAAWNDGLQLRVNGRLGGPAGAVVYDFVATLNTLTPVNVLFPALDVDYILFTSAGGVQNPSLPGGGAHFVLDNLNVPGPEAIVPEPGTWAMMIAGFGLVGAGLRRRRAALVSA